MVRRAPVLVLLMLGFGAVLPASGSLAGGELLPVGQEFQVNTATGGNQLESVVAALGSRGFFTARITFLGDGGFIGRLFGSDGSAVGSEFPIASEADDALQKTYPTNQNGSGVMARLIGPEGFGSTLLVNEYTLGSQDEPAVAVARDGSVMIVWVGPSGVGDDVSGTAILGRFFRTVLFRDGFESGGTGAWSMSSPGG